MKKRMLAILMTIAMVGGVLPITSFAGEDSNFKDTKGHWASAQIDKWSGLGIVCGSDGYFRPDAPITRGEMAVILDKVIGYQKTGNNTFSDLDQNFYTDAVLKINAAGVMVGDGDTLRPKDYISRQEAAVMLGRALDIAESNGASSSFADNGVIGSWAKGYVNAMSEKGLISGVGQNRFAPTENITRGAVVTILDHAIKGLFTEAKEYVGNVEGTVIVNANGAALKDMVISGDLIIAEGVSKGDVTLDNVTVSGKTIVRGGGEGSIYVKGSSRLGEVNVIKISDGVVSIKVAEDAKVDTIIAQDGSLIVSGKVEHLSVTGSVVVTTIGANIKDVNVTGRATVELDKDSKVETLTVGARSSVTVAGTVTKLVVSSSADDATIAVAEGAMVSTLVTSGTIKVDNKGVITKAEINADDVVIGGKVPTTTVVGKEVKTLPVDKDGKTIAMTAPAETPKSSGGGGGGGGGGGHSSNDIVVNTITITGNAVVGATLTAAPAPDTATVTYQWMRCDTADGTYAPISGAATNKYTTIAEDAGKFIKVTVVGTGNYTGKVTSVATAKVLTVAEADQVVADEVAKLVVGKELEIPASDLEIASKKVGYVTEYVNSLMKDGVTATVLPNVEAGKYDVTLKLNDVTVTKTIDMTFVASTVVVDADQVAADAVVSKIKALPKVEALKLSDESAVREAKEAYNGLTDAQRALIPLEVKHQLTDATNKMVELGNEPVDPNPGDKKLEEAKKAVEDAKVVLAAAEDKLLTEEWMGSTHGGNYENILIAQKDVEDAKKALKAAEEVLTKLVIASQNEIDTAVTAANKAIEALVDKDNKVIVVTAENKEAVAKLVAEANKLVAEAKALDGNVVFNTYPIEQAQKALDELGDEPVDPNPGDKKLEEAKKAVEDAKAVLAAAEDKLLTEEWMGSTHGGNYEDILIAQKDVEDAKKALKAAEEVLTKLVIASQNEIDAAVTAANKAIEALVDKDNNVIAVTAENKEEVAKLVAEVNKLVAEAKALDENVVFNTYPIEQAQKALDELGDEPVDPNPGDKKLEEAKKAVEDAKAVLAAAEDKLLTEEWIGSTHGGNYEAILFAQKDVEDAKKALKAAEEVESAVEKLDNAIAKLGSLEMVKDNYTTKSWASVEDAFDEATEVQENEKATKEEMIAATTALETAINSLLTVEEADELAVETLKDNIKHLPALEKLILKDKDDVNEVLKIYNELTSNQKDLAKGEDLNKLLEAEKVIKELEDVAKKELEATSAVETAKSNSTQENMTAAKELVEALKDSKVKTDLTSRLNEVQDIIDVKIEKENLVFETRSGNIIAKPKENNGVSFTLGVSNLHNHDTGLEAKGKASVDKHGNITITKRSFKDFTFDMTVTIQKGKAKDTKVFAVTVGKGHRGKIYFGDNKRNLVLQDFTGDETDFELNEEESNIYGKDILPVDGSVIPAIEEDAATGENGMDESILKDTEPVVVEIQDNSEVSVKKDIETKDTVTKDTVTKDTVTKDTVTKDTVTKDTVTKDTVTEAI